MLKKKSKRESREQEVLMGIVDLYIRLGKPVGSETLKEHGFQNMSSATIRNYFALLEEKGLLTQQHASGGRIPTPKAYKLYASEFIHEPKIDPKVEEELSPFKNFEKRELSSYLHRSLDHFSKLIGYPAFLSTVRFDHDLVIDLKLVMIDQKRFLCILITDFGQIYTEPLSTDKKLSTFSLKRIESYFLSRLRGKNEKLPQLNPEEQLLAKQWYNEIMVRYLVRYSNYSDEDLVRAGFAELLKYPELNDPVALASALSLFENAAHMRLLLADCMRGGQLKAWIGQDLVPYAGGAQLCAVLAIPYKINLITVGAIGLLGPARMPYPYLLGALSAYAEVLTKALTTSLYKFKLTFREPRTGTPYLDKEERLIARTPGDLTIPLIENKE